MNLRNVVRLLLVVFVVWRALAAGLDLFNEARSVKPSMLKHALTASEEKRIEQTLRFYELVSEGPIDMHALYRAIVENTPRDARIFVVAGDHPRLPRALVNLASFFYPRRLHVAGRSPEREDWRLHPDLFVLTLAGPHLRDPEDVLAPVVTTDAWILWAAK